MSSTSATVPRWISTTTAARIVGVTRQTIALWIRDPKSDFPRAYRLTKRILRLDEDEVRAWLTSKRLAPATPTTAGTGEGVGP
jgi:excisionase family DNA binding protein